MIRIRRCYKWTKNNRWMWLCSAFFPIFSLLLFNLFLFCRFSTKTDTLHDDKKQQYFCCRCCLISFYCAHFFLSLLGHDLFIILITHCMKLHFSFGVVVSLHSITVVHLSCRHLSLSAISPLCLISSKDNVCMGKTELLEKLEHFSWVKLACIDTDTVICRLVSLGW